MALGADSDGPALALWSEEGPAIKASTPRFSFIDLESLTVSKIGTTSVSGTPLVARVSPSRGTFVTNYSGGSRAHVRAAADGALFGIWNSYVVTDGLWMLKLNWGGALVATAFTDRLGQIAPGPDGQTVYTGSGVRYSASGQRLGKVDSTAAEFSRELLLPSFDPAYYLSIGGLPAKAYDPNWPHRPGGAVTAAVHAARDGSRLFSICGLDEMADPDNKADWYQDDFTPDKRFHLVPAAGMLITIPLSNDRLVLRGLKLRGSVEGAGTDRLVVVSRPDVAAVAGQKLVHQIVARSNKGGITFELARGPEGLAVAPDGTVAWMVPAGQKEGEVTAVVTVGDASGAELFHTLKIHVE